MINMKKIMCLIVRNATVLLTVFTIFIYDDDDYKHFHIKFVCKE